MHQERLNYLSLISIEGDEADNLDTTELIKNFAAMKSRKVNFM